MGLTEEEEMAEKIGIEERKLMIAQRKLESIRVLDELLERVKVIVRHLVSCNLFQLDPANIHLWTEESLQLVVFYFIFKILT